MEIYGKAKGKDNKTQELKEYDCYWCGYNFYQYIDFFSGNGKHNNASSQVKCKKCNNFIKTN